MTGYFGTRALKRYSAFSPVLGKHNLTKVPFPETQFKFFNQPAKRNQHKWRTF